MIKTADEILIKYAASFDDFPVPPPKPPKPEDLVTVEPKEITDLPETPKSITPIPIPISKRQMDEEMLKKLDEELDALRTPGADVEIKDEKKPLSIRDSKEDEPPLGTPEWAAKNHTEAFLLGVKEPYRGWIRDPHNNALVEKTMDKLVEERPKEYFTWRLNRRQELLPWIHKAATNLIERDPVSALLLDLYKIEKLNNLQPKLWERALDALISESVSDPKSGGSPFPDHLFNKMRMLAGELAMNHPEFYLERIAGKPITTKQFDEVAKMNHNTRITENIEEDEESKIPQSGRWPKPKKPKVI